MGHLAEDNKKIIRRIRRLKGQIEGIERMLEDGSDCYKVLQNVAACKGAFNSLAKELIIEHIEHHLIQNDDATKSIRSASKEVKEIVASYLK